MATNAPEAADLDNRPDEITTDEKPPAPAADLAELEIVYRKLATLIPYARNARTHSEEQINKIAASIQEFGWTSPMLVSDNGDGTALILA
ncbi:MAG: ParB N-terminal domain-containing protein, partial [Hyphomicrobiaceae bacterium]|nr:ParB N-terminal domain-containing protein [Hyphomicrobiaceae bacterium]